MHEKKNKSSRFFIKFFFLNSHMHTHTQIHPISGPIEGGTLVSIEGSNLGSSFDEIKDRVSIGGIPCEPIQYNVSIRIVCRTGASMIGPQSAFVIIGNRAGVTRAQEKFQYKVSNHFLSQTHKKQSIHPIC